MSKTYEEIETIFSSGVSEEYLGEDVKLVEHMLQCADLAREAGAPDHLIVASLLHDIGHLLVDDAPGAHDSGVDAHHDEVGARWIEARFPSLVSEPVRLHVAAKRYLVTTNADYLSKLSHASVQTLYMQGGPLNQEEVVDFISRTGAEDAVRVRLWDDLAKIRDKKTSSLSDFREAIDALATV
ncbi:MAG: HD domain-containing protein [Actinomycetota bacterium]